VEKSQAIKAAVAPGQARIYFQIGSEEQRSLARSLQSDLAAASQKAGDAVDIIPGIELVRYAGPPQLRYFFKEDHDRAQALAARLAEGLPGITCVVIGGYENKAGVKPQLFEVWIGSGTKSNVPPAPANCR